MRREKTIHLKPVYENTKRYFSRGAEMAKRLPIVRWMEREASIVSPLARKALKQSGQARTLAIGPIRPLTNPRIRLLVLNQSVGILKAIGDVTSGRRDKVDLRTFSYQSIAQMMSHK